MTPENWVVVLRKLGVSQVLADKWSPVFAKTINENTFSLGLRRELPDFVAQICHESSLFERLEENLNYTTPERLMAVWPKRFLTLESCTPYIRNPRALAEKVYGGRMGNIALGEGYEYRGRGFIMVTGKNNYLALQRITRLPLISMPELLCMPGVDALNACIQWWEGNVPDSVMGDITKVTRAVNGGTVGLEDRIAKLNKAVAVITPFITK